MPRSCPSTTSHHYRISHSVSTSSSTDLNITCITFPQKCAAIYPIYVPTPFKITQNFTFPASPDRCNRNVLTSMQKKKYNFIFLSAVTTPHHLSTANSFLLSADAHSFTAIAIPHATPEGTPLRIAPVSDKSVQLRYFALAFALSLSAL